MSSPTTQLDVLGGIKSTGNTWLSTAAGSLGVGVTSSSYKFEVNGTANVSGALTQGGNQVLHAGNYSSYALPLSGGTVTGVATFNGGGTNASIVIDKNIASPSNYWDGLQMEVRATSGTAGIGLHRNGYSHVGIYHDETNYLRFNFNSGTAVLGYNTGTVLGTGNYNYYAPTLTGTGASGTWGISITGTSASTDLINSVGVTNNLDSMYQARTFGWEPSTTGRPTDQYGQGIAVVSTGNTHNNTNNWITQLGFGTNMNTAYFRTKVNTGAWGAWRELLHSGNYSSYALPLSGGTLTGGLTVQNSTSAITLASGYTIGMGDWGLRNTTPYGWIQFGPANTSWAHIYADRTFYFNQELYVLGNQVLHAGNYSSYALPLSGGTVTGLTSFTASESLNLKGIRGTFSAGSDGNGMHLYSNVVVGDPTGWGNGLNVTPSRGLATWGGINIAYGTNAASTFNGQVIIDRNIASPPSNYYNGLQMEVRATSGVAGISLHRNGYSHVGIYHDSTNELKFNMSSGTVTMPYNVGTVAGSGNVAGLQIMHYAGFTLDANTMPSNSTGFTYQNNAPYYGPVARFSTNGSYDLWLNAPYIGGNDLAYRTRNGDNGTLNPWKYILNTSNYTSYAPSLTGSGASGTWGINVSGQSRAVYSTGYGTTEQTWLQDSGTFAGYSGWASYIINNHGSGASYYNQTLIMPFWGPPQYSRLEGGTFRGPYTFLSTENYNSYAPTLTGGGASGTWSINVTGSASSLSLGSGSITSNSWAGSGGYHGYTYSGGNFRFGFSSTAGVVDVYADGNFYATDSQYLVLHTGNYSSYTVPKSGGAFTGAVDFLATSYAYGLGNTGSSSGTGWQIYSHSGYGAMMAFHRGGYYAVNMGLDSDNVLRIGGWSASANRFQMDMSGNLTMAGNVTAYSDIRLKSNIERITGALAKVLLLRGVTFTRTDQEDKGRRHAGVIAQELEEVLPEVVFEDASGTKHVAYGNIVGLLIEAIKELAAEVRK